MAQWEAAGERLLALRYLDGDLTAMHEFAEDYIEGAAGRRFYVEGFEEFALGIIALAESEGMVG